MRIVRYTNPSYRSLVPAAGSLARSSWSGLETEIDRLFETALGDFAGIAPATRFPVDLYEDKDNTYVRAELPGVRRTTRVPTRSFPATGKTPVAARSSGWARTRSEPAST